MSTTAIEFISKNTMTTKFRKVLIMGLGRSGTSAMSSLLYHLDFFLGGGASASVTKENDGLRDLLSEKKYLELNQSLENDAQQYYRVAWKNPKLMGGKHINFLTELAEDWLVIVIFRDPVAVAKRRVFSDGTDFSTTFADVTASQLKLTRLALNLNKSVVLVSYEKLILNMKAAIQELIEHLDIKALTDDDLNNIVEKMILDQKDYRDFQEKVREDFVVKVAK